MLIKWENLLQPDTLFDELPSLDMTGWDLATDVYKKDGDAVVEMQLPGIPPDSYDISLDENTLTIKGERKKETEVEDEDYYRKEIQRGHFERNVQLPEGMYDESGITTSQEDGVLKIRVPK